MEKISYERHTHEPADDRSLSEAISRKLMEKNNSGHRGLRKVKIKLYIN